MNETYSEISIPLKEISTVKYDLSSNLHKGFVNPVLFIIGLFIIIVACILIGPLTSSSETNSPLYGIGVAIGLGVIIVILSFFIKGSSKNSSHQLAFYNKNNELHYSIHCKLTKEQVQEIIDSIRRSIWTIQKAVNPDFAFSKINWELFF